MDLQDLTGRKFGRWSVISLYEKRKSTGQRQWNCRCECGTERLLITASLTCNRSQSCGCYTSEIQSKTNTTHGLSRSSIYKIWSGMKERVLNPQNPGFVHYGGRGIGLCDRWKESFEEFYRDMGPRPSLKHSIDRINNDGPYSPENCRWATPQEQSLNRSRNVRLTYNGRTQTIIEWAHEIGLGANTITCRLIRGWTIKQTLETQDGSKIAYLTYAGRTQSLTRWAVEKEIPYATLSARINRGWRIERAIETALQKKGKKKEAERWNGSPLDETFLY